MCDELEAPGCTLEFAAIMTLLLMKTMAAAVVCPGCTYESACNYDPSALQDDGSCLTLDECGVCGGEGIPEGNCDCNETSSTPWACAVATALLTQTTMISATALMTV